MVVHQRVDQLLNICDNSNGNILSDSTSLNYCGCRYLFFASNDTSNGCEISSDVVVVDDMDIPVVTANFTGIVDCYTPTVSISGAGSSTVLSIPINGLLIMVQ